MAEHDRVAAQTVEELLESSLESVDQAEDTVLRLATAMGFDEDDMHRIGIAVRECMVNAVVHGNRYHSRKKVHLTVSRNGERLEILKSTPYRSDLSPMRSVISSRPGTW